MLYQSTFKIWSHSDRQLVQIILVISYVRSSCSHDPYTWSINTIEHQPVFEIFTHPIPSQSTRSKSLQQSLCQRDYNRAIIEHLPNTSGAYRYPQNVIFGNWRGAKVVDIFWWQVLWRFCGGNCCGGDYWQVLWWQLNWPQLLCACAALQILVSVVLQHRLQCCS